MIDLQHVLQGRQCTKIEEAASLPYSIDLLDMSFLIGDSSNQFGQKNDSTNLINIKQSKDLAQEKKDDVPINVQLLLQIKSPLTLDIYHEDLDQYLICDVDPQPTDAMKTYLGNQQEVHTVLFQGLLRNQSISVKDMMKTQNLMKNVLKNLNQGKSIDVQEWKITDIDLSLSNR